MILGFEEYTEELSQHEKENVVPIIKEGLLKKKGKENAVTNKLIREGMHNNFGIKLSSPRVRKIIHYLRVTKQVPYLLSSSKGYYVSESKEEIDAYRKSLQQRIRSIKEIEQSLK